MTQRSVPLHHILFTQDSISAWFDDDRSVDGLIADLRSGKVHPTSLGIEVFIDSDGEYWTLSNRRLFAVEEAFHHSSGYHVFVTCYDSSHGEKLAEWQRKRTTTTDGDVPRVRGREEQHASAAQPPVAERGTDQSSYDESSYDEEDGDDESGFDEEDDDSSYEEDDDQGDAFSSGYGRGRGGGAAHVHAGRGGGALASRGRSFGAHS
jgi:hypothetical protein